jgi:hypothetical protein
MNHGPVFCGSDFCYFRDMADLQALLARYSLSTDIAAVTPIKARTGERLIIVGCVGQRPVYLNVTAAEDLASELKREGFDDLAARLEWALKSPLE